MEVKWNQVKEENHKPKQIQKNKNKSKTKQNNNKTNLLKKKKNKRKRERRRQREFEAQTQKLLERGVVLGPLRDKCPTLPQGHAGEQQKC